MHGTGFEVGSELRKHGHVLDLSAAARTVSLAPPDEGALGCVG